MEALLIFLIIGILLSRGTMFLGHKFSVTSLIRRILSHIYEDKKEI